MGANFYRIPKDGDFSKIKNAIKEYIESLSDFDFAYALGNNCLDLEALVKSDWRDEQGNLLLVHLGKRSSGWKFLWNFHRNKFYSNKEELFSFIRSGRVFDEYGDEQDPEKFIQMTLNWYPEGHDSDNPAPCYNFETGEILPTPKYGTPDTYIDGLRVSTPQECSTYFS